MINPNTPESEGEDPPLQVCCVSVYLVRSSRPEGDAFRVEFDTSQKIYEQQPKLLEAALVIAGVAVQERLDDQRGEGVRGPLN